MSAGRYRLAVLSFDAEGRLRYWPDALLGVDAGGRISEIRRLGGTRPQGTP